MRQETGDRRQETGDRRQETGDRRQETGDRRQETGDRRQRKIAKIRKINDLLVVFLREASIVS
ncbi:hypothetical protein [Prosthecochloris aestuarii]|uniref:hypothetical protein n=1 Tax=Prosthecochloris aestuarii TaxID=1102 RepID=UPI0005A06B74|nr:hypothetical protein [Prosthecochloris aestuarii]